MVYFFNALDKKKAVIPILVMIKAYLALNTVNLVLNDHAGDKKKLVV